MRVCGSCGTVDVGEFWPGLGVVCPTCRSPVRQERSSETKKRRREQKAQARRRRAAERAAARASVQRTLAAMESRDWLEYLTECRRLDRRPHEPRVVFTSLAMYDREEPGNPLGRGMPVGRTLRLDGESHRDAWMRVTRMDPCAYCGRVGVSLGCPFTPSGTVDHIEPQSRPVRGLGGAHSWLNYTGCCMRCNSSKGDGRLLLFMLARHGAGRDLHRRAA